MADCKEMQWIDEKIEALLDLNNIDDYDWDSLADFEEALFHQYVQETNLKKRLVLALAVKQVREMLEELK